MTRDTYPTTYVGTVVESDKKVIVDHPTYALLVQHLPLLDLREWCTASDLALRASDSSMDRMTAVSMAEDLPLCWRIDVSPLRLRWASISSCNDLSVLFFWADESFLAGGVSLWADSRLGRVGTDFVFSAGILYKSRELRILLYFFCGSFVWGGACAYQSQNFEDFILRLATKKSKGTSYFLGIVLGRSSFLVLIIWLLGLKNRMREVLAALLRPK